MSKGGFIVHGDTGGLAVSYGVVDELKNFTGTVVRLTISSSDPENDAPAIRQLVEMIGNEESGQNTLPKKVAALGEMVAENGLKTEETRTELVRRKNTKLYRLQTSEPGAIRLEDLSGRHADFSLMQLVAAQ